LKWKNWHESAKKTKPKHLLCVTSVVIFRSNKVRSTLETHLTKATAVGKSNNAGVGGRSSQVAEGPKGFGEADGSPDAAAILQLFSTIRILGIFWNNFLFKTAFFNG